MGSAHWVGGVRIFVAAAMLLVSPGRADDAERAPDSIAGEAALLDRLLFIEDRRLQREPILQNAIGHPDPKIRRIAILTAGKIKDLSTIDAVIAPLNRKKADRETKKSAALALGFMGHDATAKILQQHSQMQADTELLETILFAMGRSGSESHVANLAAYLAEGTPAALMEVAAQALGLLWSGPSEKWPTPQPTLLRLVQLASTPGPIGRKAAFALARFKGDATKLPAPGLIEAHRRSSDDEAKAFLTRVIGRVKIPDSTTLLIQELANVEAGAARRIEAAKALSAHPPTEAGLAAAQRALEGPGTHLVAETLELAYAWGTAAQKLAEPVEKLYKTSPSTWLKGLALRTLVSLNPVTGKPRVYDVLAVPNSPLLEAAVSALAIDATPADLEKLVSFVGHKDLRVAEAAIEALSVYPEDKLPPSAKPALRKVLERGETGITCLVAQLAMKRVWKDFAGSLASVYPLLDDVDQIEAKIATLDALAVVGDRSHVELLDSALNDPERLVALSAAKAKLAVTGQDDSAKVPKTSIIKKPTPPTYEKAMAATRRRVKLVTNRGEAVLQLLPDAPLTAFHFVTLVEQGFYNGKTFHRVVPNFVAQGGDPLGDGYGGPGFLIRDEPSVVTHERGIVGIATAGPDTGGCQFFVNLGPNLHLDGKYTAFAKVVSGIDVFDRIEVGDRIVSAKMLP
jgi:cyclophilin family peptidyl-prolyl cis-trans isomerase/HEAT repeat protein